MRKWPSVIIIILAAIIFVSTLANADSHITVYYRLLNTTETGTTTIAAMELEIINNNAFDLNNLSITLTSPAASGFEGKAEIKTLLSKETKKVSSTFTAPKGLLDMEPLFFEITYTDKDGQQQKAIIQGTKR